MVIDEIGNANPDNKGEQSTTKDVNKDTEVTFGYIPDTERTSIPEEDSLLTSATVPDLKQSMAEVRGRISSNTNSVLISQSTPIGKELDAENITNTRHERNTVIFYKLKKRHEFNGIEIKEVMIDERNALIYPSIKDDNCCIIAFLGESVPSENELKEFAFFIFMARAAHRNRSSDSEHGTGEEEPTIKASLYLKLLSNEQYEFQTKNIRGNEVQDLSNEKSKNQPSQPKIEKRKMLNTEELKAKRQRLTDDLVRLLEDLYSKNYFSRLINTSDISSLRNKIAVRKRQIAIIDKELATRK
jgi:hypothetical protein